MDQALRTLEHASRASPGDTLLARRYRSALRRPAALEPAAAADRLDRLQGVRCFPRSGESGPPDAPAPNRWRLVAAGQRPLLLPEAPADDALSELWWHPGQLRYLSAGVVVLETPDEGLEARAPASGSLLWRLEPELGPGLEPVPDGDWEHDRREVLGWTVVPWGAARIVAHFERDPQVRRVGRYTARGRVTEREVVGHGAVTLQVALQLALPEPTWVSGPPETLLYAAECGEALADTDVTLDDFNDQLLALSLDVASRQLALRWRDTSQDWSILLVSGDAELSSSAGPAGWEAEPPDDPFQPSGQAGLAGEGPDSLELEPQALVRGGPRPTRVPLPDLREPEVLPVDGGALVVGRGAAGHELHQVEWSTGTARRRFAGWELEPRLEGRRLRTQGPGRPEKDAALLVADRRLYLQTGDGVGAWGSR